MRPQLLLVAAALALLLSGAYLNGWLPNVNGWLPNASAPLGTPSFSVPGRVGPWTAVTEERLDAKSESVLEPSAYALRRYEAAGRTPIYLYVGFYAGRVGSVKAAHNPELCYPAAGWRPLEARPLELRVERPGGSDGFRATLLEMRRGVANELVVYWFQPAGRWPLRRAVDELLYVYDAVAGRPQYAFVRLVGDVSPATDRAQVVADLREFAERLAWPIRSALNVPAAATAGSAVELEPGRSS